MVYLHNYYGYAETTYEINRLKDKLFFTIK